MEKSPEERAGEWIARAMAMKQMSQTALASASGLSRPTVCNALNSKHDMKISTFLRIMDGCNMEVDLVIRPRA